MATTPQDAYGVLSEHSRMNLVGMLADLINHRNDTNLPDVIRAKLQQATEVFQAGGYTPPALPGPTPSPWARGGG
jgi:hypothetical protein